MEITLTVNGKQVKATVDEQEMKEAMGERKKTGYETCWEGYFINREGEVEPIYSQSISACEESGIYKTGNFYSDKKVAEKNARADALMRKLRRFAAEQGACLSGKRTQEMETWHIYMNKYGNLDVAQRVSGGTHLFGEIAFATYVSASKAIYAWKAELLWYFTEYDPMPEEWWEE